jgi:predicted flap endonuclease-1-like 5' DNA nuclease
MRWLTRLLILGLIIAAAAWIANRLMSQEEDFDDFDDIDAGFDFEETPVEIDVPAEGGTGSMSGAGRSGLATVEDLDTSEAVSEGGTEKDRLTVINGVGPAYEARLYALGINTLADLARADAGVLSDQLDVIGGQATLEDWISQAQRLAAEGSQGGPDGSSGE